MIGTRRLPLGLVRFVIVGFIGFGIDFGLLWLLHDWVGAPIVLSTATAFLVSFFVTYTLQRAVAFRSDSPHGRALIKYTALVAFNTVAAIVIVALTNSLIDSWAVGKIASTALTTVWNYFIYRWWIFPRSKEQAPSANTGPLA